jgi:hypothetical protein
MLRRPRRGARCFFPATEGTRFPIIFIAPRTKSIFHWGKAGLRGAFIAASTEIRRASMTLSRLFETPTAERQAIFLG